MELDGVGLCPCLGCFFSPPVDTGGPVKWGGTSPTFFPPRQSNPLRVHTKQGLGFANAKTFVQDIKNAKNVLYNGCNSVP